MTDVVARIITLMEQRHWTAYKLARETGLSSSTIANMFRRNTVPSISTLETICNAFGITLAQFFSDNSQFVEMTSEQKQLFDLWVDLTPNQKELIEKIIAEFK